ncbi:MAG: hypothetical protein CTY35_05295 [Methylotenera sp.]|uniref:hypothetical protein n=1 Tax=Methylotenera sp. TaxID=2051956 RepID=UPI000D4E5BDD|nr:hypothetical protein [Methylotenera sp.]PPC81669.1 MAG: hypothetical protein CTY38_08340 [Methylotenera sp.]PPC98438.1 MAG: hypothetical protein CTY35_05295 [Methylotenera sp.]
MLAAAFLWRGINLLSALCLILVTTPAYADEHQHLHQSQSNAESSMHVLKPGEKWKTDEVVKLGMDNIRQAISVRQDDIIKGRLSTHDYHRIAIVIERNAAEIVRNCKLAKDADRAFHRVVLVDLLDGVTLMRTSKNIQAQRVGALGVLQSLRNYGKYFQHDGWSLDAVKSD